MKNQVDYNQLAIDIHQEQKEKGWYDEFRSDSLLINLVKSEMFEAFEAWRKGKYTERPVVYMGTRESESEEMSVFMDDLLIEPAYRFILSFKEFIKDTLEDELADTCIRLLDFAAYKGLNLLPSKRGLLKNHESFLDLLDFLDINLTELKQTPFSEKTKEVFTLEIQFLIKVIEEFCEKKDIDLHKHIALKRAYNRTRSARHGNKKA